jgi:Icc-related predicted phosphoesterase
MKLLYCSDLHGNEAHYSRLIALAGQVHPDLIVLGGDLLPDDSALVPAQMGHGQPQFVRRQFRAAISTMRDAADGAPVLVIFGNHDWTSSITAVEELAGAGLLTILDHTQPTEINGLSFLGYSYTPPTPWFVKDFERLDRPGDTLPLLGGARWDPRFARATSHSATVVFEDGKTIEEDLSAMSIPTGPWVFVAHAPPHKTHLDRTYSGVPWGSHAIRSAIEKHQPLLSLHGHVHESPAVTGEFSDKLNNTIAVNAGQSQSTLDYATIEIDVPGRKVLRLQHGHQS